jgi:hypothetical protein
MARDVEQSTVVLNLGSGDEPNTLYLTFDEARSLAAEIENDLLAGEHRINVVDVLLQREEALELLSLVEEQLETDRLMGSSTHNWAKEGF